MELYHKQLNSVADLKREKLRLKKARKKKAKKLAAAEEQDESPLASFASIAGDFISSKGSVDTLLSLGMPLFRLALKKTEKGFLKKIAKEVIGGYVKWKAIDLGISLTMRFIRMQKHKADKEHKDD